MTSLFRELVSVPTEPCFSIKTVDAPSLYCSLRAIARPTTPPPITAWVKSASRCMLDEKCLELESTVLVCNEDRVRTRNDAMMKKSRKNDETQRTLLRNRRRRVNNMSPD